MDRPGMCRLAVDANVAKRRRFPDVRRARVQTMRGLFLVKLGHVRKSLFVESLTLCFRLSHLVSLFFIGVATAPN